MTLTIDESRVEAFVGQVATDVGAARNTARVALGDRLGPSPALAGARPGSPAPPLVALGDRPALYRAMADAQPVSAADLATRTSTHPRYVREWLNTQADSG